MSWRSKIARADLPRVIAVHESAWSEIDAKGAVDSLEFQAEHDRLGDILVELWEVQTGFADSSRAGQKFDQPMDPAAQQ